MEQAIITAGRYCTGIDLSDDMFRKPGDLWSCVRLTQNLLYTVNTLSTHVMMENAPLDPLVIHSLVVFQSHIDPQLYSLLLAVIKTIQVFMIE